LPTVQTARPPRIENIDAIRAFTAGIDYPTFSGDRKTVYAVTRALEIISEASRRLPVEVQQRHPEVDWAGMAGAGNVYRHGYDSVDESQLWNTVHNSLETVRKMAVAELAG